MTILGLVRGIFLEVDDGVACGERCRKSGSKFVQPCRKMPNNSDKHLNNATHVGAQNPNITGITEARPVTTTCQWRLRRIQELGVRKRASKSSSGLSNC